MQVPSLAEIKKTLVAAGAAIAITSDALADGHFSYQDGIKVAVAWLGVLGVFSIKNKEIQEGEKLLGEFVGFSQRGALVTTSNSDDFTPPAVIGTGFQPGPLQFPGQLPVTPQP